MDLFISHKKRKDVEVNVPKCILGALTARAPFSLTAVDNTDTFLVQWRRVNLMLERRQGVSELHSTKVGL